MRKWKLKSNKSILDFGDCSFVRWEKKKKTVGQISSNEKFKKKKTNSLCPKKN